MTGYLIVLVMGIALVAFGMILILFLPQRQGGTVRAFSIEVNAPGAGLVLIVLGVSASVLAAPNVQPTTVELATPIPPAATQTPLVAIQTPPSRTQTPAAATQPGPGLTVVPSISPTVVACIFKEGFKKVHDLDPKLVGECVENEVDVASGTQQRTEMGVLQWRRTDDWVAFTNGEQTWVLGASSSGNCLARRPNAQRFEWEQNPEKLPLAASDPACR